MVPLETNPIDACFRALEGAIAEDPALAREFEASRAEFFPAGSEDPGAADPSERGKLARRRWLEWFLLEKVRTGDAEARIADLIASCIDATGSHAGDREVDPGVDIERGLAGSHASVFEVTEIDPAGAVRLWDLAGLFECVASEPEGSNLLLQGDLIAGRVFPVSMASPGVLARYRISSAADVWRNPRLLEAIRADLERARTSRAASKRSVLRLRQSDLEAMFHAHHGDFRDDRVHRGGTPTETARKTRTTSVRAPGGVPARVPTAALELARAYLLEARIDEPEVRVILEHLSAKAPGGANVLRGWNDALAEILEELAFETSIDLEAARRILLAAWEEMHALPADTTERSEATPTEDPASEAPTGSPIETGGDVASAIAAFEKKRREGAALDEVFRDLERQLGLAEVAGEDEEETPAPDFPGVVGAIVEEFLWEVGLEHGAELAARFAGLRTLGRFAAEIGVFENLTARELSAYVCHDVLDRRELADGVAAENLVDALESFCAWAQTNHEVPLADAFAPRIVELRESLPRLVAANARCPRAPAGAELEWLDFAGPDAPGRGRWRGREVGVVEIAADRDLVSMLRAGDVVRGRRKGERLEVFGCFPASIRELELA